MTGRREFIAKASLALIGLGAGKVSLSAAGGPVHVVRKGDTLGAIAIKYKVSVASLKQANNLKTDTIKIGQKLTIPSSSQVASPTPAKPSTPTTLAEVIKRTRTLKIQPGRWKYVVVHHSGIEQGNADIYHRAHLRRGMENGLAYHFVIGNGIDSKDGQIEIGPRWLKQLSGGHVRNRTYNDHGIGICLVGNFEKRTPSTKQLASLTALIDWLRNNAALGTKPAFTVHRWVDRNHTVCPGRNFPFSSMKQRYA